MATHRLTIISLLALATLCAWVARASAASEQSPVAPPKKTISIGAFESPEMLYGGASGEGLSAMLADALVRDGRFVVVERAALLQVQAEQSLGSAGAVAQPTAAPAGRMIGASAVVLGTVTKYNPQASSNSFGIGGMGGGPFRDTQGSSLGFSGQTAEVEINIRLVDNTTGQVVFSGAAKGTASAGGVSADIYTRAGTKFGGQAFRSTPLGKAAQDAIQSAVKQIDAWMDKLPWSALVIENDAGTVYINAGSNQNMREGMTLHVYRAGKPLIDPGTGELIDVLMNNVGAIQIHAVRERTSICAVIFGDAPARGDVLKLN